MCLYYQRNATPPAWGKFAGDQKHNLPQAGDELFNIPLGHHKCIIDKCFDNPAKAYFYVKKTLQNNWSRSILLNFINTDLYQREGKKLHKAVYSSSTLPPDSWT